MKDEDLAIKRIGDDYPIKIIRRPSNGNSSETDRP